MSSSGVLMNSNWKIRSQAEKAPKNDLKPKKAPKTISTIRRQLSLSACDAPAYRDQQNAVKSIWEILNFARAQICCQRVCYPMICQVSNFVRNWFPKTVLAANLPGMKICHSQMNIDATLLSICSFCNIWYRSLSNFYSATAKTHCKMGFSLGKPAWRKFFCNFSDFDFEIWNFDQVWHFSWSNSHCKTVLLHIRRHQVLLKMKISQTWSQVFVALEILKV